MDKRSLRTQKNIRLAFLNILKRKDLEEITITELCKECNIHRKTFYAHYKNTSEILDEVYDELIFDIEKLYKGILIKKYNTFEDIFARVNRYFLDNLDMYHLLSNGKQSSIFTTKILTYFNNNVFEGGGKIKINTITNKYTFFFCLSGIASLYIYYLKNYSTVSITDISSTCVQVCKKFYKI